MQFAFLLKCQYYSLNILWQCRRIACTVTSCTILQGEHVNGKYGNAWENKKRRFTFALGNTWKIQGIDVLKKEIYIYIYIGTFYLEKTYCRWIVRERNKERFISSFYGFVIFFSTLFIFWFSFISILKKPISSYGFSSSRLVKVVIDN